MLAAPLAFAGLGCAGASSQSGAELLSQLSAAMATPVDSIETSHTHSRTTMEVVETGALERMNRVEVQAAIGRGDSCSRHPRCAEEGFSSNDWFYTIGSLGSTGATAPILIVGFDREGIVDRTWYLRTH